MRARDCRIDLVRLPLPERPPAPAAARPSFFLASSHSSTELPSHQHSFPRLAIVQHATAAAGAAAPANVASPVRPGDVRAAASRIRPFVRHTPLEASPALGERTGGPVHLKMECWQVTGSFKARGAFNRILTLTDADRARGVIAPTAGNHGIGLSWAAARLGVPASIYIPEGTDRSKVRTLTRNGAKLRTFADIETARLAALAAAEAGGQRFVSAYNDQAMVAGGGTVGVEILDDLPDVDVVVVPVGGGGLVSGIGTIVKTARPSAEIWGVQAANSPTFLRWLEAGFPVPVELQPSIAAGLSGTIEPETITFPMVRALVDRMVAVTEDELTGAVRWMLEHHQQVVEPSGAAAVAAALAAGDLLRGRSAAVVITGRNVGADLFLEMVGRTG